MPKTSRNQVPNKKSKQQNNKKSNFNLNIQKVEPKLNIEYNYDELSFDVWYNIASYLLPKDIIRLLMTSKTLYSYMIDDIILKQHIFELLDIMATNIFKTKYYPFQLKTLFEKVSKNSLLPQNIKDRDLLSDNYLSELKNKYNSTSCLNLYSLVKYWYLNLAPFLYLNPILKWSKNNDLKNIKLEFSEIIVGLQVANYSSVKKHMRNSVWFVKKTPSRFLNYDFDWLIKITFKISGLSSGMTKLICKTKIGLVNFCDEKISFANHKSHCIKNLHQFNVRELEEKNYLLSSYDIYLEKYLDCVLPKDQLLDKMFGSRDQTDKYFELQQSFDISEFNEIRYWTLLYEFIIKIMFYKNGYKETPKIYYGDFKNITNDNIRKVFHKLNKISLSLVKILKYFNNVGRHTSEIKNRCKLCQNNNKYIGSDSDSEHDYCDRCGDYICSCFNNYA